MKPQSISQVSKQFNISARTLRYYEQMGLIAPVRDEENSYRIYDEDTLRTLQQIIVLRKLRIPLRQIAEILKSDSAKAAIDIFEENLNEIEGEITALSTIRSVIKTLLDRLELDESIFMLPDDESLLEIVDSLTVTKISFREEKNMEELNQASRKLNKLTDRDVRIIYLPPCTVASAHYYGDGAECITDDLLRNFAITNRLIDIKPDFRYFGFNHDVDGQHGYERWITIPDNIDVQPPLIKKEFKGGLYAAHMIPIGAFEEWQLIFDWASNNPKYEIVWGAANQMNGFIEEHLNCYHNLLLPEGTDMDQIWQLDLLIAVREK